MNLFDEQKRSEIIARISHLTPEAKGLWGKMNANQMICHCTDQLRGCLGELDGKTDESNFLSRSLVKWLVLYVIAIPKDVPTSKHVDQVNGDGTRPTDFESDRKTLLQFIEKMTSQSEDFAWSPHFKFGQLNREQWGILSCKHLDHHLKQFGV